MATKKKTKPNENDPTLVPDTTKEVKLDEASTGPIKKVEKTKKVKKVPPTPEELASPMSVEQSMLGLRRKVRFYYDVQEMRLQAQGRLTKKAPGATIELHPRDIVRIQARLQDLEVAEGNALRDLEDHLADMPFYHQVRPNPQYKGLGPRMWGVVLSSFDIKREDTVSKMWAFAGLAPIPAQRCKQCSVVLAEDAKTGELTHPSFKGSVCPLRGTVMGTTTVPGADCFGSGKAMKPVAGEKLRYNSWLRSKLCGVLGEVLIKLGSQYRKFYDDYKHRKESAGWGVSPLHRHKAAIRYMIKMLLLDIWKEWREFEGLEVRPSYQEQYLGHTHHPSTTRQAEPPPPPLLDPEVMRQMEIEEAMRDGA
jgi:hypothetical protein